MKKFFLILSMVLIFTVGLVEFKENKVEASTVGSANYYEIINDLVRQGKYVIHWSNSPHGNKIFVSSTKWVVGEEPNNGDHIQYYSFSSSSNKWYRGGSYYAYAVVLNENAEILYASHDVLRPDGSVFFSAPVKPIVTTVEEIPKTMTKTLVDGGVLSTALIVLAIMLGVLLVRRFPFWFLR